MKIREAGVYSAQGSEDKGRVEWKFEYLVQPRLNHMGEQVNGEKVNRDILSDSRRKIRIAMSP